MTISKTSIATLENPVAIGAIESDNGSFSDTPERRAYLNATESAAVQAANDAAGFNNAVTRALQPDPNAVLDALDAQKMIEPSTRVRNGLRAARTMAYARDILKNPDRYQDGDAFAALNALSGGFAKDVSAWKQVQGMTEDDPRRNLATYVSMLDGLATPSNLAAAEPTSPYANYYEATRSQETRDWDALASAPLDVRFSHAVAKDPGGWRLTDAAKDWVHANLFDEDKITPEEEAAWVVSEGGYDADAMRRYFANRGVRGKGAKEIVRDRERQLVLEGAAGVLVHSNPDDGRIPDQDYLVNPRQGKDGQIEYDRIDKLTDLTLEEYAETEKRRDDFIMKRRIVDAYQKRMEKKAAEDRARAMIPFLNEYEAAAALSALRGEDMAKYKSFFENGFGNDTERRDMVWSVCASLRPRDAHGAWEDLIGRFGEGVEKAAFLTGKAATSLLNSYTRWPQILGTLATSGQKAAIAEKKMSDEELKEFTEEMRFALQYRQTMQAWIPNTDDNFAEQAVKGLADSGFLQGTAITASLAHIGGSTLLSAPHPAAKLGGAVLHGVGYLTDAFGAASMIGDSFENMMLNGVDAERAAAVGLYAGSLNYLIEKGNVDMFLGKGLSPAEIRRTGFRALFKAIARKDPNLVVAALKADAKQAGRIAISECAEEFGQALVDSGALKFAKGDEFSAKAFANAYINQDTLKDGIDSFIDAIPTCTGFGLMSNHSPLRSKNAQAIDAYEQLAEETAKRYALQYHVDTANAKDMAKVKRLVLENAARHARTAANMDVEQRRDYFGRAAQEAGMSPSEAAFYEQAADLYKTLTSFEGQQFADAAMHGEINEAVLDRAGIAVGHDENGYINAVTVDGHTRAVVTERGTRVETDAHTGETGNVRGYYDPKDDSIHITVPETVSDVGETARTTTAPHELLHAVLEAMANDPALTEEQRQTLDALLKTETPSPNGTKLDANEAAAQFVERVFAVANRDFTPDREVVALGNVIRNIGIALKNALGSKSEYLPAIIRKAGEGGISITDLLDPSFLDDLDALQIAAADKGTSDPVVAWYANTMQPFFKAIVDAKTRTETASNLNSAEEQTAAERGDSRGDSAAAGITFENATASYGETEHVEVSGTASQPSQESKPSTATRPTINLPNGYSAECELEEMPLSHVVMPGDPDYDENIADLNAMHEAEPEDGVPVVAGGGNLICGVNAIRRSIDEGKTRIVVRRIRRLRKEKKPSEKLSAFKEAKRTSVRRFLEVHGYAYPALHYWLEHGHRMFDGNGPYIKGYLDRLSPADRMFLTGFGKGGTPSDHLLEHFLNQYRSAFETMNERHYDGPITLEDVLDQALRERDAYRQWKADGALTPDEQRVRDEHDDFIAEGHTEAEWNQHLEDLGNPLLEDDNTKASDTDSEAIDAQIAEDVAAGFFSLVREYDDILGDQLADQPQDAPRYSLTRRELTADPKKTTLETTKKALKALSGVPLVNDATGIEAMINAVQRNKIVSSKALNKSIANGFDANEHNAAASIIDKLWKHAELAETRDDENGDRNIKSIKRFVSVAYLGKKEAFAYITAKESEKDGHRIYSIELEKLEKLEDNLKGRNPSSTSFSSIVSKLRAKVNGEVPRFSLSRTPAEQSVYDRCHDADGKPRKGWMKAPNGKPTRLTERQWLQVRTPAFKKWFGDWENAYYTRGWFDVREAEKFISMPSTDVGHIQPIADKSGMKEAFRSFGDVRNADDGRVVRFPMEMAGRTVFFKNYANAFKMLFEGSKRAWSENETQFEGHKSHPNIEAYHHYLNKFHTEDGEYFVRFTVREGREGASEGRDIVHAANVTDVEVYKNGTTQTDKLDRSEVPDSNPADKSARIDYKIAHFLNRVNRASVSKAVDENSEPLVAYHGSTWDPLTEVKGNAAFRTGQLNTGAGAHFGTRKAADERSEGNKNWKIGAYYLSIFNPLEVADTGYWTPSDIVAEIRKTINDFPWLDNWNAIKSELKRRGYDGFKYMNAVEDEGSTSYVAFDPEQIKSATDNVGAFGRDNADIRYSVARMNEAARRKDLLAVHNLHVEGIRKIAEMGGFAMPSIAVVKDDYGHREFGDCTVLFDKSTIDPKKNRQNVLYSHDAWTPSFPKLEPHIDMKAAYAFTKTIRELVDKVGVGDVVRSWYSFDDEDGVARMLDHADSLAAAYAYETAAKAAYLVSHGRPVERVMTPADYSQKMPYKLYFLNNEQIVELGEKFGARIFDQDGYLTGDFDEKLADDIHEWAKRYRKDGKPVKELDLGDVYKIGQTLLDIRRNGMDEQFDRYETENRIQKAVSSEDPGLVKWLEGLTKDIVSEYGVWNGKEIFDARGNRRSWKALHEVPTLENIVKSMKKTQLENGSGVLGRNTFGVAVKKFRTTDDMIVNENLLKLLTHEEEKSIKDALSERLSALVGEYMQTNEHPDNNQFIEHDRALDMMFDAWEQGRGNFTSMKKLLNGWGYSADDDLVRRIKGVFDDMSVMVTNYFEAKPQRAVRFDEMKAWIVPDTITAEERKILDDNGQRIYTYRAGDETDRLRAVNRAADATGTRFSLHVNPNLRDDVSAALKKRTSADDNAHQMKWHDEIVFSGDFPFFEFLGLPNVRVVSDVVKIRKFAIKHHLTEDQISDLPNRYNNPVAVMKDGDGGFVALTDMKAQSDNGEEKPVRVYLRPKTWRSGEVVFVATAMAENAADERKYYEPLAKSGLLFADENRIAGLGLEEETESILRTQASGDRVLTASDYSWWSTRNSIANPAANVNAPRFSLSLGIEGEGDPFAAKNNPVDFLLAHRIFANGGKVPSRKETDRLLKRFGSKEQPRDVIARAVSLSQNIAGFLDRIGQNPDVVRAVAAAGLAVEAKGAQVRAQNALMQFDAKAAEAKGKIDAAYRRQVENASGIGYREMLSYYGLDMEQILLAMPPPSQNRAKAAQDAAGDAPMPDVYELTDADRAAVDAAVAAIVSRGEGLAAAANAEHPGQPEKATAHETTDTVDEAEADSEFLRAQAMNAAVVEAVRKSGITIDNPLAMVALVRRLTEDYIRRNPDTVPDFNEADPFASRVALAVFAANLSQFAQAVAQGYAPSYARVRIARLCERLDGRGLSTLRQVERVGEMIFADLSRDVIRQSRADLMRNLHNGDAPKKGEAKDPNRWRGIDYYAKKHGVNLAEPDRVVSAFAGNYLRILKRVVELSQAKAAERAAKLQEAVDAFKDTDDKAKYRDYQNALLELDILAAYGSLRTKMPAEIADKAAAIKSFVTSDLDAFNAKKEAFEQKRVALRDAMTAAIAGNPKDNGRMPDKHPGFLYSLVGMLDARASVLTSFCKDPAKRQAALDAFGYVQRLLFHGYTQERAFLNDAKVAMRDAVKSVFGRFGQNTFAKLLDTKLDEATCKLLDRGGQKTKWRIGNVMQMYVSCLQADYAENCKTHGRDGDYVNVLKSVIEKADPRLLRMIDVMRGMYAGYGREISRATLSASGVPIQTPNPLYMPVKPLLLMRAKNGEGRAFHPYAPSLTPRVKHGYDFDQSADIMELWQDRIQQSAHTIGFLEAAPLIQGTMQSSHVLEAIHAAWGEQYANHWNDYVLTCLAGRKATSMPKVMSALSRAASRLFLWFNVGSNLNQLQAVFTSALSRDVGGMRGMAKHLSFWALKPVEMWQAARDLTATRAFKARYGSDLNAAIAAAQREGKYGVLRSTVGTIADIGMKGIEIGDRIGVLALANVYRSERNALENAGMSPTEASERAAEKLMLIAENTAQGTTDMNTFDEQSRLGSLTSLFMQFKTAPLQQFGYEFAAFQDWKAAPTDAKRAMKLLSTILVNHVLANIVPTAIDALMTAAFGAIRGDDDKEKEKNRRHVVARALARVFLGPFGAVMFYGVIADNAVQFVANWMTEGKPVRKTYGSSGSLPADNAVEMILNAAEGGASVLFKSIESGTLDDLVEATKEAAIELSTMTYPGRLYKKAQSKKKK